MKLRPFKEFKTHLLYLFKYKIYFIGLSHGINSHLFKGQLMALGQSKRRPKRSVIFLSIQFSSIFCSKTTLTTTTTAMTVVDDDDWATKLCYVFKVTLWFNIIFKERKTFFFHFCFENVGTFVSSLQKRGKKQSFKFVSNFHFNKTNLYFIG